ncbi:MAG: hypothetical protein R3C97_15540 [Geminicoccaceae bacterium]
MAIDVESDGRDSVRFPAGGAGKEEIGRVEGERLSTIYAPSTPFGRGAVGIYRLSGERVGEVCNHLTGLPLPEVRRASLRVIRDPASGREIDRVLFLFFRAPESFTGEDMLEIHHHGGVGVTAVMGNLLAESGICRMADPGELSKRAFLNGKLDLMQAEGIADLVDATTALQVQQSALQMLGGLSERLARLADELVGILANVEAEIDFAVDSDVPEDMRARMRARMDLVCSDLRGLLEGPGRAKDCGTVS